MKCQTTNNTAAYMVHSTLQCSGSAAHERQHKPVASSQQHRCHLSRDAAAAVVAPVVAAAQIVPAAVAAAAVVAVVAAVAAVAAAAVAQSEHGAAAAAAVVAADAVAHTKAASVEVAGCESLLIPWRSTFVA